MAFSCCGLVCEIGISLTTYYRRRTLDCGSQTLRRSRTGRLFRLKLEHVGVRPHDQPPRPEGLALRSKKHRAIGGDRKSTRLNSSHRWISYAVFRLKKARPTCRGVGCGAWGHAFRQCGKLLGAMAQNL